MRLELKELKKKKKRKKKIGLIYTPFRAFCNIHRFYFKNDEGKFIEMVYQY